MIILVTAGNTATPIDEVRCISNIFTGRTGYSIADTAYRMGHDVKLLTSDQTAEVIHAANWRSHFHIEYYKTFNELEALMAKEITSDRYDAVVHSAAVSDYKVEGVFDAQFKDVSAGKVKSSSNNLWLKLVPTPKLVDKICNEWDFHRILVKFKLEVGITDNELLRIAEASRKHSMATMMCANTLENMNEYAYLGCEVYEKIPRPQLAFRIVRELEIIYDSGRSYI
jgi:phosphopantothenoylcysteine synthetase/decarboxylase